MCRWLWPAIPKTATELFWPKMSGQEIRRQNSGNHLAGAAKMPGPGAGPAPPRRICAVFKAGEQDLRRLYGLMRTVWHRRKLAGRQGVRHLFGDGEEIAATLRERIRSEWGLPFRWVCRSTRFLPSWAAITKNRTRPRLFCVKIIRASSGRCR